MFSLDKYPVAMLTYQTLAEHYGPNYVTSNVNISMTRDGSIVEVPLGNRFRKFKTEQGRDVTAFGPLFNFRGQSCVLQDGLVRAD